MEKNTYPEHDPRHHTIKIKAMLSELADHSRQDASKVTEPKAQALFETTTEVLKGLMNAYEDYERKNETAWK